MDVVRRLPLPLLVAGAAMVVAALHTGDPHTGRAVAVAATYAPPAASPAAPGRTAHVRVRPPHQATPAARARRAAPPATASPAHPTSAPAVTTPAHAVSAPKPAAHPADGPTGWPALDAAIARIPTYRAGAARWVVSSKYDFWGTADWYHDVLYVDPGVPADKLYDVAVHEWSHELSVLAYGGDVFAATQAMNAAFGGHGLTGPERAADCMSILQGAGWTHYTTCTDARWRAAAAKLVAGKRLA